MRQIIDNKTTLEELPLDERLANAIAYRSHALEENSDHILKEILSDAPHVYEFVHSTYGLFTHQYSLSCDLYEKAASFSSQEANSFSDICYQIINTAMQINIPTNYLEILPVLLLSGVGVYAGSVNIKTLFNERAEQKDELKSQVEAYKHFLETGSQEKLNLELNLEAEGASDTGVRRINRKTINKLHKSINESYPNKSRRFLRSGIFGFAWRCAKDILLNYSTPSRIRATAGYISDAIRINKSINKTDKEYIKELKNMIPVTQKIKEAKANGEDTIRLDKQHVVKIKKLDEEKITSLDSMRADTKEKTEQLIHARKGFVLQSFFIGASAGLAVYQGRKGNTLNALFQVASGSLATSPFRGVVRFADSLHSAIMGHRAEEKAELLSKEIGLQGKPYHIMA